LCGVTPRGDRYALVLNGANLANLGMVDHYSDGTLPFVISE
jgi:hypothetical protein